MSFEEALAKIKADPTLGMRLPHWSPEVVVCVQYPDEHSKMTSPYLYVSSRFGRVPWKETFPEMFSNAWSVCANCQAQAPSEEPDYTIAR